MKNFDWESFKEGKIVVHCKTKKEAEDLCLQMHEHGMTWESGNSYLSYTYYEVHKNKTCYSIGGYQSCDYFRKYRCNILEWSDYMQKEFTKADLKDGMVVKHRNGDKRMVISEALIGENGYADQNCFREDLTHRYFKDLDIVGVYAIQEYNNFADMLSDYNLELIWERTESKKMTVEEMRKKLEELTGEEIEVVQE
ncbi:hypothetical protein [Mediterraneibacter gnavus]|uniref:hypothetical protein n=1 Tax=Mediterraneibacter gnavus TaxID=33038 RepID=UPI000C7DC2BD|nr:hypothetical protein [Mediterraneibacter gnavus]PLT64831.1 hypothetical protein CCY17_04020 [Mediterraneibacter gnavus]